MTITIQLFQFLAEPNSNAEFSKCLNSMKKIYLSPTIRRIEAEAEEMMNASIKDNGSGTLIVDLGAADETPETSGNLARQSIWDEDE